MVKRALALDALVRRHADRAEAERRLPEEVAAAMASEGLYRIAAPAWLGGADADPMTQIEIIEAIAYADGATAWNLMIGIEAFGLVAPSLEACADLLTDPAVIMSAATSAMGRADEVSGGYRIEGQWQFVSGVHNSSLFAGTVQRYREGELLPEAPSYAVLRRDEFEILDTWHVGGLRGSGSHDLRVSGVTIPVERLVRAAPKTQGKSRLQRIPIGVRLAYNKVGVCLGIARGALDAFTEMASSKTPRFGSVRLRERPFAQRAIASGEARLRSARALVFEQAEELWVGLAREVRLSDRDRAIFQIACSDAARACVEAVDTVAEAAGTSANQVGHPLERHVRDVRVVRQHITVAPQHLEDAGRVLLGLPAEGMMLDPTFFERRPDRA